MSDEEGDGTSDVPLQYQRAFGAGTKRKRIDFVPQSAPSASSLIANAIKRPAGDVYLSIAMPKKEEVNSAETRSSQPTQDETSFVNTTADVDRQTSLPPPAPATCPICNLSLNSGDGINTTSHELSLAHQVCLQHSHPPSHIDRRSKGLNDLSSCGWDPDARLGLGATGEGRLYPVRAVEREDRRGIGAEVVKKVVVEKKKMLDAGGMRRRREEDNKREERLRDLIYGREDVNRYLGLEL